MLINFKNEKWSTIGVLDLPNGFDNEVPLVVSIHAGGSNKAGYRNTFVKLSRELLEQGIPMFRFDLPWEGESEVFVDRLDKVDAIHDLLHHIKSEYQFKKIVIVGHCVGGFHALSLTSRYPNLASGVVLWHVVPILYAMAASNAFPRVNLRHQASLIYTALKQLRRDRRQARSIVKSLLTLSLESLFFPLRVLRYLLLKVKQKRNSIQQTGTIEDVLVVINPSKLHYREVSEGIKFTQRVLTKMGCLQVRFVQNNNKVFSTTWQTVAFQETIRYVENLRVENTEKESILMA